MSHAALIDEYLAGPAALRAAVAGMSREQQMARPIAGKWSTLEVVCHLADFEPIYAERIKRVIVQPEAKFYSGDPNLFAKLAYESRDLDEELAVVEFTRRQLGRVLRTLSDADFQRQGVHSEAGPMSIEKLLRSVTAHITHHLPFIAEKRQALGATA